MRYEQGKTSRRLAAFYGLAGFALVSAATIAPGQSQSENKESQAVTSAESAAWLDHVIPLPKETRIERKRTVPIAAVRVRTGSDLGAIEKQAVSELRDLLGPAMTDGSTADTNVFTLVLGLAGDDNKVDGVALPDIERARTLPNREQAYLIRPADDRTLVIAALSPPGLYYGVQTLKQLIAPFLSGDRVVFPMASITDWPDLSERGLWNSAIKGPGALSWMAGLKLNFETFGHGIDLNPQKERCPPFPTELKAWLDKARAHAFHILVHCTHYDFWIETNKDFYPKDLIGRGDTALNPAFLAPGKTPSKSGHHPAPSPTYHPDGRAPCASNPRLRNYLTEWLTSAARQGVRDASLWMTEYQPCYCSCERCLPKGGRPCQLRLETVAGAEAIREARKSCPDLTVRLFVTTKDEREAAECFTELPRDTGIKADIYRRTKASDDYAARGGWVASYSGAAGGALFLDCYTRGACPFRLTPRPEAVRDALRAYRAAKYAGVYTLSYGVPGLSADERCYFERRFGDYLVPMLAEWSWNADGRSPREFNRAWATQRGYNNIDAVVSWLEIMAPLEAVAAPRVPAIPAYAESIRRRKPVRFQDAAALAVEERAAREWLATAKRSAGATEKAETRDMIAETDYTLAALDLSRGIERLSLAVAADSDRVETSRRALDNIRAAAATMRANANSLIERTDAPSALRRRFRDHADAYLAKQVQTLEDAAKEATREK